MKFCSLFVAIATSLTFDLSTADVTDAEREILLAGLGNVEHETIDQPAIVDIGAIPKWLNGNFMRHACGSFGMTSHRNLAEPNYIMHLFDCLEMGSKFRLENGEVTFTNRFYDSVTNDIYNVYGRDMNKSSVFRTGTYSKANASQVDRWAQNMTSQKVAEVPHVSWWQIGNEAIAMSESPIGVILDPHSVKVKGHIQYNDDVFGEKLGHQSFNNPAHEHTEPDGTLWSTSGVMIFTSRTTLTAKRLLYKVGADRVRQAVAEYTYGDIDLTRCHGHARYPDLNVRLGYLHSFAFTENYVIMPEAGYMMDPCFYAHYDSHKPFFPQGFSFEKHGFSRLIVIRKSDGAVVRMIKTQPFFVTHQLGSYEEGDQIHMDMLMYGDSGIYDSTTFVDSLLLNNNYITNVTRISINVSDWSASFRNLRLGAPSAFEMSNINYAYNGRKYTYAYMVKNFDLLRPNALTKLNVDTGFETDYAFPVGMFVQEPQFIPRPGATAEDDGVLIAQGVDGRKKKAFLTILDARTMTLEAHVTAPDLALFGIHENFRFFPFHVGTSQSPDLVG